MGKNDHADPDDQEQIVQADTPKKNVLDIMRRHNTPPNSQTQKNMDGRPSLIYP